MLNINFKPFPILKSKRLVLRQLNEEDANEIFILRSDERVNKYIDRPATSSLDKVIEFINKINIGISKNEAIYWVITLNTNPEDKLVGTICLWNIDKENYTAEIGYELIPEFQGIGIMQEAVKEVIEFGFQNMHLEVIHAFTHPENEKSTKLLERFNFKRDIDLENKIRDKEETFTDIIYSLKKSAR